MPPTIWTGVVSFNRFLPALVMLRMADLAIGVTGAFEGVAYVVFCITIPLFSNVFVAFMYAMRK